MASEIPSTSSIAEIEDAIEKLPTPQVGQLTGWLEMLRVRRATPHPWRVGCSTPAVLLLPARLRRK